MEDSVDKREPRTINSLVGSDPRTVAALRSIMTNGLIYAPGSPLVHVRNRQHMQQAVRLRDEWLQDLPLMPAITNVFIQTAVSREWTVTGTPRRASRAVEKLNGATHIDYYGRRHYGWSEFSARRVLDWLTVGEVAMIVPWINKSSGNRGPIQYVDPSEVRFNGSRPDRRVITSDQTPSSGTFMYDERDWRDDEIFFNHINPVGGSGMFNAPLMAAVPICRLLWLINEHDSASLDGRRLRDIIIAADDNMRDALIEAYITAAALWSGFDAEKHGIPVVAANKAGGFSAGEKVEDLYHILGLSNIPESYDRETATLDAANYLSGLLGMDLRSWYSDPRGTNRALERVNQERARVKGPAYFCRSEQRHINRSGFLGRVHFAYVEETDVSVEKSKAEVVKTMAEAVEKLSVAVGDVVSGQAMLTYLKRMGVFLEDFDLVDEIVTMDERPVQPDDMVDTNLDALIAEQQAKEKESQKQRELENAELERDKQKIINQATEQSPEVQRAVRRFVDAVHIARMAAPVPIPDYGQVTVNRDGLIVEHRRPVYPVAKTIAHSIELPPPTDFDSLSEDITHFYENGGQE